MINLFERYGESCTLLRREVVPSPLGGYITTWVPYLDFVAAISLQSSSETRIAEAQGLERIYVVAVDRSLPIFQGDVFRRVSDGQTFRATSNTQDLQTPEGASVPNAQFTAEEWELPTT